jgi:hypothetical protein
MRRSASSEVSSRWTLSAQVASVRVSRAWSSARSAPRVCTAMTA